LDDCEPLKVVVNLKKAMGLTNDVLLSVQKMVEIAAASLTHLDSQSNSKEYKKK